MKQHTVIRVLTINDSDEMLTISVIVGNAQPSHTDIYVNGFIIYGADDSIVNHEIGFVYQLKKKELLVVTTVRDIPANADRIIVTHELNIHKPECTIIYDETCIQNEVIIDSTKYFIV